MYQKLRGDDIGLIHACKNKTSKTLLNILSYSHLSMSFFLGILKYGHYHLRIQHFFNLHVLLLQQILQSF